MLHQMKLQPKYFDYINYGTKRIELRLNDEKRSQIQIGDEIEFVKEPELTETMKAKVVGLLKYNSFADLIKDFDISILSDESMTKQELLNVLQEFYTPEKQAQYGVLGIRIEKINKSMDSKDNIYNKLIYTNSYYNVTTNFSCGYTIDCNGIIEEYNDSNYEIEPKKAQISNEELISLKKLAVSVENNYIEILNPESILNPDSPLAKVEMYHDYGVEKKEIYNYIDDIWITLYKYGDEMGYNDTKETRAIIELTNKLYNKYIIDNVKDKN